MAKKKKKTKLDRFVAAAKDLNDVLGLKPPIDVSEPEINDLAAKLREASKMVYEDDNLQPNTEKVLAYIGSEASPEPEEEEVAEEELENEEEETPEEEPETETEVEETEESEPAEEPETLSNDELAEKVKAAKNRKALLQMAMGEDAFAELEEALPNLRSEDELREAMLDVLSPAKKSKPKKSKTSGGVKKASGKKSKKPKAKKTSGKVSLTQQCRNMLEELVKDGGRTREEIVNMIQDAVPDLKEASIQVVITDSKNPKYNKLSKLVVEEEDGTLSFE